MKSFSRMLVLIVLACGTSCALALDASDCAKVLAKDYYVDAMQRHLELDFLKTIDAQSYQELKKDASISVVAEAVPIGASYSEFNKARNSYLEKQQYRRSEAEARNIVRIVTSERAYGAYESCLRTADTGPGLRVWASKESMDIIELRVLYKNPPSVPSMNLTGTVIGGEVAGAPAGLLWDEKNSKWGVSQEKLFLIRRAPGTSETTVIVSPEDGSSPMSLRFQRADGLVSLRFDGDVGVLRTKGISSRVEQTPNNDNNRGNCERFAGRQDRYCVSWTEVFLRVPPPQYIANARAECEGGGCAWTKNKKAEKVSDSEYRGYIENWGPAVRVFVVADVMERVGGAACGAQQEIPVVAGVSTVFTIKKECFPLARLEWKRLPSGDQGAVPFNAPGNSTFAKIGDTIDAGGALTATYRLSK